MKVVIKFFIILYLVILKSSVGYASDESINIGLLAPLSGEYSNIGKSIIQSSKMGINKIDDSKIHLITKDADEAITALEVLGYSRKHTIKIINKIKAENPSISVESLIKKALNKL